MIIDFHTHTFPDKIAQRAIAGMQQASHAAAFAEGTLSGLQESMQKAGISHSVVLPVATNPAKLTSMNDSSLALNGRDGIFHFGAVHPLADNWQEELARIADAGIKGIKIHPHYQGVDIDDIRYLRLIGRAAELGLITVMHSGLEIGYPGVVRCSPEMTASALRQLGDVPSVLAHRGGWKNWNQVADLLGPTGCMLDTAISLGAIVPNEPGHYEEAELGLLDAEGFCQLVRAFGSHRVLFGTESPWADQAQEVAAIRALPLTSEEKENIFHRNAEKLLQLNI
jgi:predicted TIM-barrel fold metal-dependent hydrolase